MWKTSQNDDFINVNQAIMTISERTNVARTANCRRPAFDSWHRSISYARSPHSQPDSKWMSKVVNSNLLAFSVNFYHMLNACRTCKIIMNHLSEAQTCACVGGISLEKKVQWTWTHTHTHTHMHARTHARTHACTHTHTMLSRNEKFSGFHLFC